MKKKANCFTTKFSQTILRNHLGFIITSAIKVCLKVKNEKETGIISELFHILHIIKYVSCNVKVDNLTFINICDTVFNTDNLFRHVLKAIAS